MAACTVSGGSHDATYVHIAGVSSALSDAFMQVAGHDSCELKKGTSKSRQKHCFGECMTANIEWCKRSEARLERSCTLGSSPSLGYPNRVKLLQTCFSLSQLKEIQVTGAVVVIDEERFQLLFAQTYGP